MQKNTPRRGADEFGVLGQHYRTLAQDQLTTIDLSTNGEPVTMSDDVAPALRALASIAARSASPARTNCVGMATRIQLALERYAASREPSDREAVVQLLAALERGMMAVVARP